MSLDVDRQYNGYPGYQRLFISRTPILFLLARYNLVPRVSHTCPQAKIRFLIYCLINIKLLLYLYVFFSHAVYFVHLGCFIDVNADRIMSTFLGQNFSDADFVNTCAQKASARGFSTFGVEAGGQCFSGAIAELTFMKHGQAPNADCVSGKGNSFRMSVYKFGKWSFSDLSKA